jgi:hypothetical protein
MSSSVCFCVFVQVQVLLDFTNIKNKYNSCQYACLQTSRVTVTVNCEFITNLLMYQLYIIFLQCYILHIMHILLMQIG